MRSTFALIPAVLLLTFSCGNQPAPGAPDGDDAGVGGGEDDDGGESGGKSGTGGKKGSGGSSSSSGGRTGSGGSVVVGPRGCGLENAAFCADFEDGPSPGGRGGDLDESKFSFSRWGQYVSYFFGRPGAWDQRPGSAYDVQRNTPVLCGEKFSNLLIGEDARICPGAGVGGVVSNRFEELFDDADGFGLNSLMVRQPWDFSDGGTLVFDVDGKRNHHFEGHGWWFELWVTEDPAPIPYHGAPTVDSFPRNGLGIMFTPNGNCLNMDAADCNEVTTFFVARDYQIIHEFPGAGNFPDEGGFVARDQELNHFEIRLNKDRVEIWGTDAGSTDLYLIQAMDGLDLSFDVGFVHLQHSQYNAFKDYRPENNDGVWASSAQTYRWDNIGFDGPVLPSLRAYEAPLAHQLLKDEFFKDTDFETYGYYLDDGPVVLEFKDVDVSGATSALMNLNMGMDLGHSIYFRINDGEELSFACPDYGSGVTNKSGNLRTYSIPIPLEQLVSGTNKVQFRVPKDQLWWNMIGNVDISLVVP